MTDQRARAEQHIEKRMNALLLYQELLTDSPPDAVTRIVAALADERRRVLKRIAKAFSEIQITRSASGHVAGASLKKCPGCRFEIAIRYLVRKAKEGR